ncbi:MAG: hypothetical protein HY046_09655 [Acidobacteria bacterium]|nr:hypothetical protein [Acidobacteriota bacterium]
MLDWRQLVRQRLGPLGLRSQREEEIRAELAEHLEDGYQDALRRGLSPETAMASAHEQVPDWQALEREIREAASMEEKMTNTAKTLWIPGTTIMVVASVWFLVLVRVIAPSFWNSAIAPKLLAGEVAISYLLFGAVGACWSRQAGGNKVVRFLSGIFPLAFHLIVFILPILVALFSDTLKFPEHLDRDFLFRVSIGWVLFPGIALAIGTLPFLRDGSTKSSMATAQATGH